MKIIIVTADKARTQFMQRAGIFESFKVVLGQVMELEIQGEPHKIVSKLQSALKNDKEIALIAAFSKNDPSVSWRNESIKAVSDGKKWSPFAAFLKSIGHECL